jgi:hypothetical protein
MMRDCIVQNVENHYYNTNNLFSEIKQLIEEAQESAYALSGYASIFPLYKSQIGKIKS